MPVLAMSPSGPRPSTADRDHADRFGLLPPSLLLRTEGILFGAVAVGLYARTGTSWWLFVLLLLVPDLGMLGYLAGPRIGAATYNVTHTLVLPILVAVTGMWMQSSPALALALIWAAHIGLDRAFGYGLKYRTGFRDTHLQRVAGR